MKTLIRWAVTLMVITMITAALPTEAEGQIYEDTLRLHILANSDTEEDQALKLEIRDRLLQKYGELLRGCKTLGEARSLGTELLPMIEEDAEEWMRELGYRYSASATISEEWYDTREYDGFSLPAGYYASLRIILGRGEGQNWWCVMYPPLCMEMATEDAPYDDGIIDYTKEELLLITSGGYRVKFKILEELSRAFAKNG